MRLMGDNGKPNDNILTHILSPYPAHRSAVTDCAKLLESGLGDRKACGVGPAIGVTRVQYEDRGWTGVCLLVQWQLLRVEPAEGLAARLRVLQNTAMLFKRSQSTVISELEHTTNEPIRHQVAIPSVRAVLYGESKAVYRKAEA